MFADLRIPIIALLGGFVVVFGVSQLPTLTSPGKSSASGLEQAALQAAIREERAHCETQLNDLDCRCFAQTSGQVLGHTSPQVRNAIYADKRALARGQASRSC